ncbi:signal peptidase II [Malonomonas rubra]|uniref:signal peptidase II n=1 Tax=Malonomonas rubra TaxID=57040 RepID=UPI0026EF165D|nr:signal peptidase II [Malonomonas rubra]
MGKYRVFIITAALSLVIDQLSKLYIDSTFALYESIAVIENFFHITYVRNPGAAFGILSNSAVRIPFFISVSVLASIGILWYLRKVDAADLLQHFALGLIFSGAVGNLIDRARLGEVIDFLDAHWYQHHWPAFNIADSAICIGVAVMFLCTWQEERKKKRSRKN